MQSEKVVVVLMELNAVEQELVFGTPTAELHSRKVELRRQWQELIRAGNAAR